MSEKVQDLAEKEWNNRRCAESWVGGRKWQRNKQFHTGGAGGAFDTLWVELKLSHNVTRDVALIPHYSIPHRLSWKLGFQMR